MLAERLTAQGLSGSNLRSPVEVVGHLLAVQAQDPRGARLSIRCRMTDSTVTAVNSALSDDRTLVVSWLNRGTLHLVQDQDFWWLHPLTTPQLAAGNARRLQQEGVSVLQANRGVHIIEEQVSTLGPRTRSQLRTALDAAGVPTAGQALVHLLLRATLRGDLIRGPMRAGEQCFVQATQWLGPPPEPLERPTAFALLARRYLTGHGPAAPADLAKWAGIPLTEARAALAGIRPKLVEREDGLVDLADRKPPASLPPPRLLGAFDPLLLGWASRAFVVGTHRGIVTTNGLFRPFALVNGRCVAVWSLDRGRVTLRPLEHISRANLRALEADAGQVLRFLEMPFKPAIVREPDG